MSGPNLRGAIAVVVLHVLLAAPSWPAYAQAIDKQKAVATMLQKAKQSYENGKYADAAEFYLNVYKTDPSQPLVIYNAARCLHLAGQLDKAEELYRQYLALPKPDPGYAAKAQSYLSELTGKRADQKAEAAFEASRSGQFALAAALYFDAWRIAPDRWQLLFRAGRAHFSAEEYDAAEKALKDYLAKAPADAPDRSEAKVYLAQIAKARPARPGVAAVPGSPPPAGAAQSGGGNVPGGGNAPGGGTAAGGGVSAGVGPADGSVPATAWIALGTGVAALGGGIALYALAVGDQDALQADLDSAKQTVGGKTVYALDHADVQARNEAIGRDKTIGVIAGGAGLAAVGVGAWLALTAPRAPVAVGPAPRFAGWQLAWRF